MLGTIKFVEKSVNDNSARRLDHCDVIASRSGFGVLTGVPQNEVELQTEFKSFTAAHLGSNTNQHDTFLSNLDFKHHPVYSVSSIQFYANKSWLYTL